ncbi:MAG: GatB/YqeY domain-containing protein [Candidatus Marinimicrobia bacterium]|nr:GatB/YqeY domain-containing protein [Candidatus Neomarinimicrobiota bacterium]MCF7829442.1 GatB/YqeY domain-containing protein [Candidatus Neomarinimicrobiota bacterium]MCF7880928.1 GatB/YqeY domain-containing protein [Candidatus Neomarinimicrobiota bacterium]
MSLIDKLNDDLKSAMKSKDKVRLETIRSLKSMLREKEIEKNDDLSEEEQIKVLSSAAKRRREAIESYQEGGRTELADQEQAELEIIETYLPEQLSEDDIRELVDEILEETGASTMQDMGRVMGAIMPKVRGQADGSLVQQIVKEKLS